MHHVKKFIILLMVFLVFVGLGIYQKNTSSIVQIGGWDAYARIHELSPMLAMPGMSVSEARQAVEAFKKTTAISVLPFSDDPSRVLHTRAYPMDFLSHIPNTEEARRNVLSDASASNAKIYHNALLSLFDAYDHDLANAIALLSVGMPLNLQSFKGFTSSTYVAEILRKGQEQLAVMREEEMRRFMCAEGRDASCAEKVLWTSVRAPAQKNIASPLQARAPQPIADAQSALRRYAEKSNKGLRDTATVGLSSSSCYASYSPTYYDVSLHTSAFSSTTAVYVTLLSDTFFYDLSKISVSFSKALYATGIPYSYQPFNVYICQDSGREFGDLLSIYNAHALLQKNPIAQVSSAYAPLVHNVLVAQNIFLTHEVLSQGTYDALIAQIDTLLANTTDADLIFFLGSKKEVHRLRDLSLQAKTRSAGFELMIGYFDDLQASTYTTAVFDSYRTNVFAMIRSGISPLLLLANETGPFGRDTTLFYGVAKHEVPPTGFTLLSYRRDLQNMYSLDELLSMHIQAHNKVMQPLIDTLTVRRAQE